MFPPIDAYAVNFANGNLHPHVNPYGWGDVQLVPQMEGVREAAKDSRGYRLTCTATGDELANGLYLVLPERRGVILGPPAVPADVRAFLQVIFDLPHAVGAEGSDFTQAWAVLANLRIDRNIDRPATEQLNVTSQFVKGTVGASPAVIDGVRLNTPGSLQQIDHALRLDGPLNYARYQPRWFIPAPTFILDHAFCGYAFASNGHTPGSGELRIRWPFGIEQRDQRVYSSQELPLPAGATIGAVGVSVMTMSGVGTFGARVRSFRLSLDRQLGSTPPVFDQ